MTMFTNYCGDDGICEYNLQVDAHVTLPPFSVNKYLKHNKTVYHNVTFYFISMLLCSIWNHSVSEFLDFVVFPRNNGTVSDITDGGSILVIASDTANKPVIVKVNLTNAGEHAFSSRATIAYSSVLSFLKVTSWITTVYVS